MEIKRDSYLEQLKIRKDNRMIKIITGIRRCGKSFLLFVLFKKYLLESGVDNDHIIEIALDGIENEELRDPKKCYQHIKDAMKDDQKYYLLLDEVQFMPRFEEVLNSLLRISTIDVYVTGSNSHFLSSDIATEFRGRSDEIHVYPLSFEEFMTAYDGDKADGLQEYYMYGGLPKLLSIKGDDKKAAYLERLYRTVYLRDIYERHTIENKAEFEELVRVLASGVGSLMSPTTIANTFKSIKRLQNITDKTIDTYIGYLQDAFLIEKSERYDIKGRQYIGSSSKYYFKDCGLRNAILSFRQFEENHIMENALYNDLRGRGFRVDVGNVNIRVRDEKGVQQRVTLEVDFVCNMGSKRYYIQSAWRMPDEAKMKQEQNSLCQIKDEFHKLIIVGDRIKLHRNEKVITIARIYDFLLDQTTIDQ